MGRSPCCEKAHTNKGAWTKEEDDRLIAYIRAHGEGCWRSLPKAAGLLRCGKSCRLRWINYLRPDLKRGNFTEEEDELIIKLHSLLGNKWSLIAGRLPGRTDNEIKNYWNTHIRRKLLNRGIDPVTHRPLNEPQTPAELTSTSTATICFTAKKEENVPSVFNCRDDKGLDLNLELRIRPPHDPTQSEPLKTGRRDNSTSLCFSCSLGIQNGKDCRCRDGSSGSSVGNDFLGLKGGVLEFRSLEMK
ncbi:hypothetical protein NMG60_11019438 [Bertholletia excelsa]